MAGIVEEESEGTSSVIIYDNSSLLLHNTNNQNSHEKNLIETKSSNALITNDFDVDMGSVIVKDDIVTSSLNNNNNNNTPKTTESLKSTNSNNTNNTQLQTNLNNSKKSDQILDDSEDEVDMNGRTHRVRELSQFHENQGHSSLSKRSNIASLSLFLSL
jgi:hypothetical protein